MIIINVSKQPIQHKKMSCIVFSLVMLAFINGLALLNLFISSAIFAFLGIFIFLALIIGYAICLIKTFKSKGTIRKKSLLINLITPILLILIISLNLPIHFNFYLLYPFRADLVRESTQLGKNELYETQCGILASESFLFKSDEKDVYAYFKIHEEFLKSDDLNDNEYKIPASEGFEYSEKGFEKNLTKHSKRVINYGEHWRYVSR